MSIYTVQKPVCILGSRG